MRIATIDLHQTTLLPALIARLRRDAPRLDLRIQVADRDRLHDQLAAGELDLAIAPILAGDAAICAPSRCGRTASSRWSARTTRLPQPMTMETFAAADHVVDAGHVRVSPDGQGASLVDTIDPA